MSAINERVSDERIANLIEVLSFYSPEDKRLANNESELASALRELQQYRAAAEPVCPKCGGTGMADSGGFYPWGEPIFIECDCHAAPQLPLPAVVPDAIEIDDDFDSAFEHGKAVGWNAYRAAMLQGAEPDFRENAETSTKCWCHTCRPVTMTDMRFVVCPECGNKRCPHANDHRNVCTGSNEPGQEGSAYPAAPKQEAE